MRQRKERKQSDNKLPPSPNADDKTGNAPSPPPKEQASERGDKNRRSDKQKRRAESKKKKEMEKFCRAQFFSYICRQVKHTNKI